jgi:hypothetical protein
LKFQAVLKIFPWNPMQVKGKLGRKGREVWMSRLVHQPPHPTHQVMSHHVELTWVGFTLQIMTSHFSLSLSLCVCVGDQNSCYDAGYILPRGTYLTCVQMKKLTEKIRTSTSTIPIYGCIMKKSNVQGRTQTVVSLELCSWIDIL